MFRAVPVEARAPEVLYRISRSVEVTEFPPWEYCGDGRFDDPEKDFRVLYAAEQPVGCFFETLDHYTPPIDLLQFLPDSLHEGRVPTSWLSSRFIGRLELGFSDKYLDLRSLDSHRWIRRKLADQLSALGLTTVDLGRTLTDDRRVTQLIARLAHAEGF